MTASARPSFFRPLSLGVLRGLALVAGLGVAGLGAAVPAGPAAAQSLDDLQYRIGRLERDIQSLQRQTGGGFAAGGGQTAAGAPLPGDVAGRLQVRVAELERLVQDLTGRVEEAQYAARQANERLQKAMEDVNFRLQRLESGAPPLAGGDGAVPPGGAQPAGGATAGGGPSGILGYLPQGGAGAPPPPAAGGTIQLRPPGSQPPQPAAPAAQVAGGGGVLPPGTPEEQYNHAFGLLRKTDFAGAETALRAFITSYPQHELAGNAQYWLGETHFVRGDYQRAAVAFLDGYKTYPKSAKGPDNLLKLGITMGNMGQKDQACAALARLASEYPAASDVIKRRAGAERDRLACR